MARIPSKPSSKPKTAAKQSQAKKGKAPRKDLILTGPIKDQLKSIVEDLTPNLKDWIVDGAEEESKLKAAKITIELMEFVQPKLTRVVMSEAESAAIAKGVGAELRKQIARRMLDATPTGDDE